MQKKNRTSFRSSSRALALEPRLLFDGAGAVAAVDHFDTAGEHQAETQPQAAQPAADARPSEVAEKPAASLPLLDLAGDAANAASDYQLLLGDATSLAQQKLVEWVGSDAFRTQAAEIFSADAGSAEWNAQLDSLRSEIINASYGIRTEVRSNAEMQGLLGAFSASNGEPTLYLNAAYLANASAEQVSQVLIEEIGHAIDHQLNRGQDSLGDEGHAFAALVIGGNADLAANQIRDDHHVLTLDGQSLAIESAGSYNIAQTHFVHMPEDQIWSGIQNVYSGGSDNKIESIIAITATSKDTHIVYDHWEDGYEADIKNPTGASTRIWWYNASGQWVDVKTGATLTDGHTVGNVTAMGQTLILRNQVNKNSMATVDFDGGDKIGSTKAISVTRAGWDTKIGTIVGGAVNLIDVGNAGTSYVIPVGTNTTEAPKISGTSILQKDSLFIMAYENNTVVTVNLVKADGTPNGSITRTLQQGQSWYIGGLASGATVAGTGLADAKAVINEGTKVTADKKIGVNMLSGSSTSQNRWYGIAPTESWGNSYYAPVATVGSATSHIYLFNNNTTDITVKYETLGAGGVVVENSVTVLAGKSKVVAMPASAGHFYTADDKAFYAVATVDPTTSRDWSYSLVAERTLTDRFVVAWGPGNGNTAGADGKISGKNGSPVWVTAVDDTYLYIDSATTELKDAAGNTIAKDAKSGDGVTVYKVDRLQSYRLRDTSDNNQTGLVVYTQDGTLITAAWGEDASVADTGNPYLDMGTTISPYPDYVLEKKAAEFKNNAREDVVIEAGDVVTYTITLTNRAVIELLNIKITDTIAPTTSATYVANSLTLASFDENGKKVWEIVSNAGGGTKTYYQADGVTVDTTKGTTSGTDSFTAFDGDTLALLAGYNITDAIDRSGKLGLQIGGFIQFTYKVTIKEDITKELADANFVVSNSVKLEATGVEKDKINKIDLSGTITDGVVTFISGSKGDEVSSFEPGNDIWIRVTDKDQDRDKTATRDPVTGQVTAPVKDTITVLLTNTTTGEHKTVTLEETEVDSGIFEGKVSTARGTGSGEVTGDNPLHLKRGDEIKVAYTDPYTGGDGSGNQTTGGVDNPTNPGINGDYQNGGINNNVKTATVEDSGISVNDILVNEASPHGVFTVQGVQGQIVSLELVPGTADSNVDYTNSLEYYNGTNWVAYTPGDKVAITNADGTLLVRNPIINDSVFEGAETYQLKVTPYKTDGVTTGSSTAGTATILDDGTGDIYDPDDGSKTPSDPGHSDYVPHDHDRFPQVDNPVVNEATGKVVFTVTTQPGDKITKLEVADGTAKGGTSSPDNGTVDYRSDEFQYSTNGGTTWTPFTPGDTLDITSPSDGKVLVRTTIVNDTKYEQSETFTLTAETITGGRATGTATIKDDGTGDLQDPDGPNGPGDQTAGPKNDDRDVVDVKVNNPVVNEASGHVVFEVKNDSASEVSVNLALNDGTGSNKATGAADASSDASLQGTTDYENDSFEYWNGTAWVVYDSATPADVAITAGDTLYVRVAIFNDTKYEGAETFDLEVTPVDSSGYPTPANKVTGTATILDDGTGDIFNVPDSNSDPAGPAAKVPENPDDSGYKPRDDDRTPVVNNPIVNEGSPYIVFEVTTTPKAVIGSLVLNDGTAKGGTTSPTDGSVDYGSTALEYSKDDGVTWVAYTTGDTVEAPASGKLLVRTTLVNDDDYEVSENFRLTVTLNDINTGAPTGNSATGVGTILDDGRGTIWVPENKVVPNGKLTPITPETPSSSIPGTVDLDVVKFDDDRPVSVNSPTVNEGSGWIVFEVGGITGTPITSLLLANGSAIGDSATTSTEGAVDYDNTSLQYFNGTAWVDWEEGTTKPLIPAGGTLLVRVAVFNDDLYENAETFTLTAKTQGGKQSTGIGTIKDDGTGTIWIPEDPSNPGQPKTPGNPADPGTDNDKLIPKVPTGPVVPNLSFDDDRSIQITNGGKFDLATKAFTESPIREDVQYTYFKVTDVAEGVQVKLVVADTTTALTLPPPMQFSIDGGTTWQNYSDGNKPVAPSSGEILVRVDISSENNDLPEENETFTLTASYANNPAKQDVGAGIITDKLANAPKITPGDMNNDPAGYPTAEEKDGEVTVYEHGLRDSTGKQKATGTIQVEAGEGIKEIILGDDSFTLDQLRNGQGTITTTLGTLKVTEVTVTEGPDNKPTKVTLTYTYSLHTPDDHTVASGKDDIASTEEITIGVKDASSDENTAESKITVSIIDSTPIATNDSRSVVTGSAVTVGAGGGVLGNDKAVDGWKSGGGVIGVLAGNGGTPTTGVGSEITGSYGKLTLKADGSYTYVANPNTIGMQDVFTYQVEDADGDKTTATLTIYIVAPNYVPNAMLDSFTTDSGTPLTGDLGSNDGLGDGANTQHTWSKTSDPANGTVTINPDGTFSYVPNEGFSGTDSFTYTVRDVDGDTSTATVTVTVKGVPIAKPDSLVTPPNTPVSGNLGSNDTPSPDGGNVWSKTTDPSHGKVVVNPDGTYTYTPDEGFSGTDSFTYTITDKDGDTSTATVTVTVKAVPVANPDNPSTLLDTPVSGNLGSNDTPSLDGGNVWTKTTDPSHGTVVVNPDGSYTYTPEPGFTGTDSFTYTITDKDGDKSTATVTVTVGGGVTPPVKPPVTPPVNPPVDPTNPPVLPPVIGGPDGPGTPGGPDLPPVIAPVPPVLPSDTLTIDQPVPAGKSPALTLNSPVIVDVGPFHAGERFDDVRRLPLPFHPIVYVNREVASSQAQRDQDDPRGFSDPSAAVPGERPPVSLGAGLGQDPNLFVSHAIRDSQSVASFLRSSVEGRYSRLGLSSDGYLASPGLFSQPATEISELLKEQRKKLAKAAGEVSAAVAEHGQGDAPAAQSQAAGAAEKPVRTAARASRGVAAPSFSEQLRSGAARLPLAPRQA